jgi:hypothetical protein
MCKRLHAKRPFFLSELNESWIFSADFRKILKCEVSSKCVQCGRRADGRTGVTEVIVVFHSFADASGKVQKLVCGLLRETRVTFFACIVFVSLLRFWGARLPSFGVGCRILGSRITRCYCLSLWRSSHDHYEGITLLACGNLQQQEVHAKVCEKPPELSKLFVITGVSVMQQQYDESCFCNQ